MLGVGVALNYCRLCLYELGWQYREGGPGHRPEHLSLTPSGSGPKLHCLGHKARKRALLAVGFNPYRISGSPLEEGPFARGGQV